MAYNELIKNFEKIRAYMREFYVYGFKSRNDFAMKSSRSYDDEKRRIESWLGDYMKFSLTDEGKNIFLSVDNRVSYHNPLYRAWKAKSFTNGDITLHFIIFDIFSDSKVKKSLKELIEITEREYLDYFEEPISFDESTIRKKLKEYIDEGIITAEKCGKTMYYSRSEDTDIDDYYNAVSFFSEVSPCGVIGSFLLDKIGHDQDVFSFKHHYTSSTVDSDVLAEIFEAMHEKKYISVENLNRKKDESGRLQILPLKVMISVQHGRQYLAAMNKGTHNFSAYRIDHLSKVKTVGEVCTDFDEVKERFREAEKYVWGVIFRNSDRLEHIDFTVRVNEGEEYVVNRLEREKRIGTVTRLDDTHYRFSADVFDTNEMVPWIRTFICRITELNISNKVIENKFRRDLLEMYKLYGIDGGEQSDIQ